MSTNEQTRKEKTAAVETLHAEIDELSASIAKLTQEITDLTAEIAEIDKAVAEVRSKLSLQMRIQCMRNRNIGDLDSNFLRAFQTSWS